MPFLAQEHVSIPNKDILSWIFDDQSFDLDKPVSIERYTTVETSC